ncbi:tetratricopeptide repeat protein [Thiolapillus sp.]
MTESRPPDTQETGLTELANPISGDWQELPRGAAIGRYIVISLLGSGGMGVVYAAYDPDLDRKLAIKLIRPDRIQGQTEDKPDAHLLREARILARLSHPNILPVFDVGRFGAQLFLAMEYVDGQTLAHWQSERQQAWKPVLQHYLQAGAGLAAAHGAGIVHRDFKPHNVLLGKDGRVRVMDFGLSQSSARIPSISPSTSLSGTPAYMAPEQLRQQEPSPLADQFSFAVALYEALYGVRPFPGRDPLQLLSGMEKGLSSPPAHTGVPGWIHKVLARALALAPQQRFANMEAFLHALRRNPAARRRQWLGAASMAAILPLGGIWLHQQSTPALCQEGKDKFAGIWNESRRQALEKHYLDSSLSYAPQAFSVVERMLDAYHHDWAATYTRACEATQITGEQSQRLLDIRMICLDSRRQEADALIGLLSQADGDLIQNSVKAVSNLSSIASCSNIKSLAGLTAPPPGRKAEQLVTAINKLLAQARAGVVAGQYAQARELAEQARSRAMDLDYPPLLAQAEFELATSYKHLGKSDEAENTYRQAFVTAIAAGDDSLAARSATGQVWIIGHLQNRPDAARHWGSYADSFLSRSGGDPLVRAQLYSNLGTVVQNEGDFSGALKLAQQVLELRRNTLGEKHERTAVAMVNLANAYFHLDGPKKSIPHYRKAYRIYSETVGDQHPNNILILSNLASALSESKQLEEARQTINKALSLAENIYGRKHFETALTLQTLANIELLEGNHEQSLRDYLESLDVIREQLGENHPFVIDELTGIVANLVALQRYGEAREYIRQGQAIIATMNGQAFARSIFLLAEARITLRHDNATAKARSLAQQALQDATAAGPRASAHKIQIEQFLASLQ